MLGRRTRVRRSNSGLLVDPRQFEPSPGQCREQFPELRAKVGRCLPNFGRTQTTSGQIWSTPGRHRPFPGQVWTTSCRHWSMLAECGPKLADPGANSVRRIASAFHDTEGRGGAGRAERLRLYRGLSSELSTFSRLGRHQEGRQEGRQEVPSKVLVESGPGLRSPRLVALLTTPSTRTIRDHTQW